VATFSEIIAGAAFRADLQNTNRVLQAEWISLVNESIRSAWDVFAAARPDFQVAPRADFTLTSGGSASFSVPKDFHSLIDVVCAPDQPTEYSLGPFNWFNRRSPGGWYWPSLLGVGAGTGATGCRLMGTLIYVEPSIRAAGTYGLWYCPLPHTAQPVRLATTGALPACTAAGAGVGKTLTANANGALTVDSAAVAVNDLILVKDQASTGDNGIYSVTVAGSAGSAWVLTRWTGFDETAEIAIGYVVGVGQSDDTQPVGAVNEGQFFTLTTFTAIESAQAWTQGASIDAILEMFVELLKLKAAITAMQRDNRGATAAPFEKREDMLVAEAKKYFSTTRSPGPQKATDTDGRLFRGGWGGWGV
jgi:hypothetical protein